MFNLLFASAIILLMFFFLFLVTFSNDLFIPILIIVNIKVKEEPAIPTGIPITVAYEAILNVPIDADKVMNILSR